MNNITTIAIKNLKPGHEYPGANINARTTGRDTDMQELKASLALEGLLQALLVCHDPEDESVFYVCDGNRRLAGMTIGGMLKGEAITPDTQIPCVISKAEDPIIALRQSLVSNNLHVPLHPVDRYTTFAAVAHKETPAQIAAKWGTSEKLVKQSLALGKIAPIVREAWKKGKIDEEKAKVFANCSNLEHQTKIFSRLEKSNLLETKYRIEQELFGSELDRKKYLAFVGLKAYQDAGGAHEPDLFEPNLKVVSDFALLKKMADDKIKEKCDELVADGWKWASDVEKLPNAYRSWDSIPSPNKPSAANKALAGCTVELLDNGKLEITYGVLRPGNKLPATAATAQKKTGTSSAAAAKPAELNPDDYAPVPSVDRMATDLSAAVADVLLAKPDLALAALLAGFLADGTGAVNVNSSAVDFQDREDFHVAFNRTVKMPRDKIISNLVAIAAKSTSLESYFQLGKHALSDEETIAFCKALPAKELNDAIVKHFDLTNYCHLAPKPLLLKAIEEAFNKEATVPLQDKSKKEIAEFAIKELPKKGWLPVEMRTAHYKGPTAKPAASKPAAEKPAPKAKAKSAPKKKKK